MAEQCTENPDTAVAFIRRAMRDKYLRTRGRRNFRFQNQPSQQLRDHATQPEEATQRPDDVNVVKHRASSVMDGHHGQHGAVCLDRDMVPAPRESAMTRAKRVLQERDATHIAFTEEETEFGSTGRKHEWRACHRIVRACSAKYR